MRSITANRPRGRRGFTIFYFLAMWVALVGFVALTVDYGRVQLVKEQLQCSADAAARAGLFNLVNGTAAAQSAAVAVAAANQVDGAGVTIVPATDYDVGYWDPVGQQFTAATSPALLATANAVQVTARRTAATGNPVPLLIASLIGRGGCDVRSTAVACKPNDIPLVNPDFEQPALAPYQYVYDIPMPGWTLTGAACLTTYPSEWGSPQPNGRQAMALQGTPERDVARIVQTFPAVAGNYTVSFLAGQRSYFQGEAVQPVTVSIDGAIIATVLPINTSFQTYSTPMFTLATGSHTIALAATQNVADHTTFVDQVAIKVTGPTPVLLAH